MIIHNQLSHDDLLHDTSVNNVIEGMVEAEPLRLFQPGGHQAYRGLDTYLAVPLEGTPLEDTDTQEMTVKLLQIANTPKGHHTIHGGVIAAASGQPVLTLASFPEAGRMSHQDRKKITAGDFSPLADVYVDTIRDALDKHQRVGRYALGGISLVGTSLGASALPSMATKLARDFDVTVVGAQSPANIDKCTPKDEALRLLKTPDEAYAEALLDTPLEKFYAMSLGVNLDGLSREKKIAALKKEQKKLVANLLNKDNALLFAAAGRGLSKGTFAKDMVDSSAFGEAPLVIGYGGKDALLPVEARERLRGSLNLAHAAVRLSDGPSARNGITEIDFTSYAHDAWDHPRTLAAFALTMRS